MPKIILILFVFLLNYTSVVRSQSNWHSAIEADFNKLINHSTKIKYNPHGLAFSLEYSVYKQTLGSKNWHIYYHHPRIGFSIKAMYLGAPNRVLGNALSIYPFIDVNLSKRFSFYLGSGLAYLNRPYHILNNPLQITIGSHWNNTTIIKGIFQINSNNNFDTKIGLGFCHYSNGTSKSPNLGLNYPFALLHINTHYNKSKLSTDSHTIKDFYSKWSIITHIGAATKQIKTTGGPNFWVFNTSMMLGYNYSPYKLFFAGFELEHPTISAYFYEHTEDITAISKWNLYTRRFVFAAHEWLIGPAAISVGMGYRISPYSVLNTFKVYNKLQFNLRLPKIFSIIEPRIGIALKSNYGTADYISYNLAFRFDLKRNKKISD